MGIIHVLDKSVAELIAAGEVVERPSSAIKELVENAIDAGATAITVEIQKGGMSLIRVTDNGCGFYPEDVANAFLRHATSKVKIAQDLDAIYTMGFRGEALASIAAVSKVELLSRRAELDEGVRYQMEASVEKVNEAAGCPVGTTIVVRDLFFNTPARLKFLKKDASEANQAFSIIEKIALMYPEISFRFIKDGQEKLRTPGDGQQLSAIYAVFGRDFAAGLLPVDYSLNGFTLTGFVSKPHKARANRSMQNFYVNRRYVKSKTCAAALEEGFKHSMMVGKFPACVLNLTVPAESVDVNVHPAKIEVRFENEKPIFDLVYFGIKNALRDGDISVQGSLAKPVVPKPEPVKNRMTAQEFREKFASPEPKKGETFYSSIIRKEESSPAAAQMALEDTSGRWLSYNASVSAKKEPVDGKTVYSPQFWKKKQALDVEVEDELLPVRKKTIAEKEVPTDPVKTAAEETIIPTALAEKTPSVQKTEAPASVKVNTSTDVPVPSVDAEDGSGQQILESIKKSYEDLKFVGEIFRTYIIFEGQDKMVLVDKHAAHERILYNRIKSGDSSQFMQTLLIPETILLSKEEYSCALEHLDVLLECGFEAEDFGNGSLLVRTSPMWLQSDQIEETISEICGYLAQGKQDVSPEKLDWLYHNISCRSAVKGGETSSREELEEILRLMREDGDVYHCPHGRPVAVNLTKKELEKLFGRI